MISGSANNYGYLWGKHQSVGNRDISVQNYIIK